MCQICPRSCEGNLSQKGESMPSRSSDHCTPSVVCACSSLPFPSFPFFVNVRLFRGCSRNCGNHNSSAALERVRLFWGSNLPFWFSLPLGSAKEGRWRRKGRELSAPRLGRGKVRRLRRKCRREWVLCRDGSVCRLASEEDLLDP